MQSPVCDRPIGTAITNRVTLDSTRYPIRKSLSRPGKTTRGKGKVTSRAISAAERSRGK